jgi:Ser/Thr protein kinase RdoA (MazF antagonist)
MQRLIEGCLKMQEMQVIHRDLRPGNILFLR